MAYVADSLLHLPSLQQPQSFPALRRWLRILPPHVAPVLFVSTLGDSPLLLRAAARTHAAHASVVHVHPHILPQRLRAAVVGQGFLRDSMAVLPPAAAAYMSAAGVAGPDAVEHVLHFHLKHAFTFAPGFQNWWG